jgi:hypothetical protein
LSGDPGLFAVVRLSLIVSLSAVFFAALIGVPFGALIALTRFRGREAVIVVLNALMGLPPVVVGLAVFLTLSRSGPLGAWGLLFTPQAMIVAQAGIKGKQASFISRGDRSGTHIAELQLWKDSGIDIDKDKGAWYKSIGQGMGAALNTAGADNAYVLSDRGTWIHFKNKGDLQILVEGDKRMFNQYGVMLVNPEKHPSVKKELGQQFIDYLVSPQGQKDIANYKIDGQQLFYPDATDPGA